MSITGLPLELHVTDERGNPFLILTRACALLLENGMKDMIVPYLIKCLSGDYSELVRVNMEYFDVELPTEEEIEKLFQEFEQMVDEFMKPLD